jgi:hypothetical protein
MSRSVAQHGHIIIPAHQQGLKYLHDLNVAHRYI